MTDRMWKLNKKEKSVASKTNLVNVAGKINQDWLHNL